jgi:hypothetical protein
MTDKACPPVGSDTFAQTVLGPLGTTHYTCDVGIFWIRFFDPVFTCGTRLLDFRDQQL